MSAGSPRPRPRAFADLWDATGTTRPPTTIANPLGAAGRPAAPVLEPTSIGPRFRRFEVDELAAVPRVDDAGGLDLSPESLEVAFAWDRSGALEIYTAPLVGDRIIQLTEAGARSWAPRWSPDGHHLAFLRTAGGATALWLVDRDGVRERKLADVGGPDLAWSPDGARIAVSDGRSLSVVDVSNGATRSLGPGARPAWSPGGPGIAFVRDGAVVMRGVDGGGERTIVPRDLAGGTCTDARWSRDGSALALVVEREGRSGIAFAPLREGAVPRVEHLGATPFDDADPAWRPDGRAVIYRRRERGNATLRRAFTVSHADDAAMDLPGSFAGHRIAADNETVVAVFASPRGASDVVVRARGAVEIAQVTRSLPGSIDPAVLVDPVYVPATDVRPPALVYVPHTEAGLAGAAVIRVDRVERGWDALAQLLANHGEVAVVTTAARGAEVEAARTVLAEARLSPGVSVRAVDPVDAYAERSARALALSAAAGQPHRA